MSESDYLLSEETRKVITLEDLKRVWEIDIEDPNLKAAGRWASGGGYNEMIGFELRRLKHWIEVTPQINTELDYCPIAYPGNESICVYLCLEKERVFITDLGEAYRNLLINTGTGGDWSTDEFLDTIHNIIQSFDKIRLGGGYPLFSYVKLEEAPTIICQMLAAAWQIGQLSLEDLKK